LINPKIEAHHAAKFEPEITNVPTQSSDNIFGSAELPQVGNNKYFPSGAFQDDVVTDKKEKEIAVNRTSVSHVTFRKGVENKSGSFINSSHGSAFFHTSRHCQPTTKI